MRRTGLHFVIESGPYEGPLAHPQTVDQACELNSHSCLPSAMLGLVELQIPMDAPSCEMIAGGAFEP
jgi:hypothetical protein